MTKIFHVSIKTKSVDLTSFSLDFLNTQALYSQSLSAE